MTTSAEFVSTEEHHFKQIERKFIYKWAINNFSCFKSERLNLPYTTFNLRWGPVFPTMGLRILGTCADRSCNLRREDFKSTDSRLMAKLWVEEEGEKTCVSNILGYSMELSKLLHKNNAHSGPFICCLLCKGNLTIICEITAMDYVKYEIPNFELNSWKCSDHDLELFTNKKHWDVNFFVMDQEIHAHKCILASRNQVFAAMFEHEMKENKSNTVSITDTNADVFEDLLRYIYTGQLLHLKRFASELLAVSEKYDVQGLRLICANELAHNISTENAAETLILADMYGANELKTKVINFIDTKRKEVAKTEGWQTILTGHTHLLAELYLKT